MTSRAGVEEGEAGGAGVVEGATENVYEYFRILVLSEDPFRLDFVSNGLVECGYSVTSITSCGLAIEMMAKPKAFHIVFFDDSVQGISLKKMFTAIKIVAEDICILIFTPDYTLRNSKLYVDQGAQLVVPYAPPYDKIKSVYSFLWQFFFTKKKFNSELRSLQPPVKKKMRWNNLVKEDLEHAVQFAGPERRPRDVAELMNLSGIRSQSVRNYMRKNPGALGAGLSRVGALGTGPSPVAQLSFVEQIALAEGAPSVAQLSIFPGAGTGAADEESRDPVLDTEDSWHTFWSDLENFQDFPQD